MKDPTPSELMAAMNDLTRALNLSSINERGEIYAYEYNKTAQIIPMMVKALAIIRQESE